MADRQMQRRVVRRGRRNQMQQQQENRKKLLYVAAGGGALLLIVLLILIFGGKKTFTAERGTLSFSTTGSGIVIRSEKLYTAEGYGKAEYIAEEGQVLSAGSPIADVYSNDYSDKDYAALKELQEKILDYQQNNAQSGIIDEDMVALSEQIASKTEQIRSVITGSSEGNLAQLQREISQLMDERADILRNAAKEDEQLASFYEQEQTLITRIQNYKRTLVAENDGIVSFYFDGTETLLTPENMPLLTAKNINNILNGTFTYDTTAVTQSKPLYRLVDRNQWYVVMITDHEIPQFEQDTAFTVTFSFGADYTYTASVHDHISESGRELYYFKFNEDVDKLLRARQVNMEISARYVGIDVPQSALKKKDGVIGVYYVKDGRKTFEPVEVLTRQEKRAIIRAVDAGSTLSVGSEIYS
jgi:putative membrane fusion protein